MNGYLFIRENREHIGDIKMPKIGIFFIFGYISFFACIIFIFCVEFAKDENKIL